MEMHIIQIIFKSNIRESKISKNSKLYRKKSQRKSNDINNYCQEIMPLCAFKKPDMLADSFISIRHSVQ